jgi:hypothetical protein
MAARKRNAKGEDGYTYVGRLHQTILYNQRWCDYIMAKHKAYWKLMTGTDLNMQLTPETQPYATSWESRRNIDRLLRTEYAERPVIFEPMCGSGSDIVFSLMDLDPARVFGVDMMKPTEFEITRNNILNYYGQFSDYDGETINEIDSNDPDALWMQRVCLHRKFSWEFIKEYAVEMDRRQLDKKFDLVMVDAPWDTKFLSGLNEIHKSQAEMAEATRRNEAYIPVPNEEFIKHRDYETKEVSPKLLFDHLETCVFRPMKDHGVKYSVVCLKVRWEMSPALMRHYLEENSFMNAEFDVQYSVQVLPNIRSENRKWDPHMQKWFIVDHNGKRYTTDTHTNQKGEYHFVVLRNKDYNFFADERSAWYDHVVLSKDPERSSLYVDKNTWLTPTKSTYSKNMPNPSVITELQYKASIRKNIDMKNFQEIKKSQSRGVTMEIDLTAYIQQLRDFCKLIGPRPDVVKERQQINLITDTIDHVKRFYIAKQDEHVNSQGKQSLIIKGLIAELILVIEEVEDAISPLTANLPKTQEEYEQCFMDFETQLKGPLEIITKVKKITTTKRLLEIVPQIEKIIKRCESSKLAKILQPTIGNLIKTLSAAQTKEILQYTAQVRDFRINTLWEYTTGMNRQDEIHRKIRDCQSCYVQRVNHNEYFNADMRPLISQLQNEIYALEHAEINYYVGSLYQFRNLKKSNAWSEFMDQEDQMNREIVYCKKWYVNNEDYNQYEEQAAQRTIISQLQVEIELTEEYILRLNLEMTPTEHQQTNKQKKNKNGRRLEMPIQQEHVEMSTLLSLLREVCVRFDT